VTPTPKLRARRGAPQMPAERPRVWEDASARLHETACVEEIHRRQPARDAFSTRATCASRSWRPRSSCASGTRSPESMTCAERRCRTQPSARLRWGSISGTTNTVLSWAHPPPPAIGGFNLSRAACVPFVPLGACLWNEATTTTPKVAIRKRGVGDPALHRARGDCRSSIAEELRLEPPFRATTSSAACGASRIYSTFFRERLRAMRTAARIACKRGVLGGTPVDTTAAEAPMPARHGALPQGAGTVVSSASPGLRDGGGPPYSTRSR